MHEHLSAPVRAYLATAAARSDPSDRADGVSIVETVYPYDGEWTTTFTCKPAALADRARALMSV